MAADLPTEHSFPASHGLQLAELVRHWDVEPQTLLGSYGLTEEQLAAPDARLAVDTLVSLTLRARELTGEPGIGIYLGLHKQLSAYGFVGFASMNAATLREALEQAVELGSAVSTAASLSLRVDGDTAALVLHEHADVAAIRDIAQLSFFVGLRHMTQELIGQGGPTALELSFPEPDYFARFADVVPNVRFEQPVSQLLFSARALDLPLPRPNRAALNLAREQCRALIVRLGFDGSLPARVRRLMIERARLPTLGEVASALHVSVRTLKRRLAEHGTSFTALLQEERELRALHLLRDTDLSLEEIADRLGFASASSFSRSYQRWAGRTPAAQRRELGASRTLGAPRGPAR